MGMSLTLEQMQQHVDAMRVDLDNSRVINRRKDCMVVRCGDVETGNSIIVKMWSRQGLKGLVRRVLRITPGFHEWRSLSRMRAAGVPVPVPLGFCNVSPSFLGYTEALFLEDLGACESASTHLKKLIQGRNEKSVIAFENELIDITEQIVRAGILDLDHGMNNIVVTQLGRLVKLDVELARRVFWPSRFPAMYGRMLGRLIGLHAFAVQPDVDRNRRFTERLCERLSPPPGALRRAGVYVRELMRKQRDEIGLDTQLVFPWE